MRIFLDDSRLQGALLPFTYTRHVADLRIGILSIREKWEKITGAEIITESHKRKESDLLIDAGWIPTLRNTELLIQAGQEGRVPETNEHIRYLAYPWYLYQWNAWALAHDFELLTRGRTSEPISPTNRVDQPGRIFLEPGASMEHAIVNTSGGPVYLGTNSLVMEGCLIRGGLSMGEGSVLKMGTCIYGAVTLGPYCTGGGEIKNSLLQGYSNKAHHGYLGDSVLGYWCNLGAGTSNSNVKNTGSPVRYASPEITDWPAAGDKAGLLMGDYSRTAINTSFPTGSMVGICCHVFGEGATPKYIPSFTWGQESYQMQKVIQDISNWKKMKGAVLTDEEKTLLYRLYENQTNQI